MKIECILKRPKGTEIQLGDKSYRFFPASGMIEDPHVAEVTDLEHQRRLLSITEAYQFYSGAAAPDVLPDVLPDDEEAPYWINVLDGVVVGTMDGDMPDGRYEWKAILPSEAQAIPDRAPAAAPPATPAPAAAQAVMSEAPIARSISAVIAPPIAAPVPPPEPDVPPAPAISEQLMSELKELTDESLAELYVEVFSKQPNKTWPRDTVIRRIHDKQIVGA